MLNEGGHSSIDQAYIDGVSVTYGTPRKHIWTFTSGISETNAHPRWSCPCAFAGTPQPPSYVGNNFFCESGNPLTTYENTGNFRYVDDPLWDGKRCDSEGQYCSNANSPPWFSVDLPDETNETIEIRICSQDGINNEGGQAPPRFSGSIHVCVLWAYMLFETDITLTLIVN